MKVKSECGKILAIIASLLLLSFYAPQVYGQRYFSDPRIIAGGSAAQFRISLDRYEEVYDGRWGFAYGWFAGVRVYANMYITVSGRYFEKDGKADAIHSEAHWKENWYLIGIRRWMIGEKKFGSSIGIGYAFFNI